MKANNLVLALLLCLPGCETGDKTRGAANDTEADQPVTAQGTADESSSFEARAAQLVDRYQTKLQRALKEQIKAGGPPQAIEVCKQTAPQLAAELSSTGALRIRRIGTRVRNRTSNTPTPQQAAALAGLTKKSPTRVAVMDGKNTYMKAIFVSSPVCLKCHGGKDALDPKVTSQLARLYPRDEATGYALGDLRGAFVVTETSAPSVR